ncbi:MAG: MoaD/ThiS family protein [Pseudomonadota bacterium]
MEITIKLGGPLRKRVQGHQQGELTLSLKDGTRVSDALAALGLDPDEVRVLMKNGRAIHSDETLVHGDRLGLFPREQAFNVITAVSFFNPLARKKK